MHILSHPTPPQLHPPFAPRTDPRADLRCAAPFLLPPCGARRRRCRHLQRIRGSSGVQASIVGGQRELQVSLAEKIPLSFFFLLLLYKKRKGKGIWERREKVGPFRRYVCYCVRSRSCYNVTVVCFGGEVCLGMLWTYSQPFFLVFGWKCCEGDSYQPG